MPCWLAARRVLSSWVFGLVGRGAVRVYVADGAVFVGGGMMGRLRLSRPRVWHVSRRIPKAVMVGMVVTLMHPVELNEASMSTLVMHQVHAIRGTVSPGCHCPCPRVRCPTHGFQALLQEVDPVTIRTES